MDDGALRLMRALEAFEICGADNALFVRRLMRTQGWSLAVASHAIVEYKRFLVLKTLFDGQVSPSPVIDKVWHLHLLYTRDYWEHLCRDTVGRDLHHQPMTSPPADAAELDDRYRNTLRLYRETFGAPAPAGAWDPRVPSLAPRRMPRPLWFLVCAAVATVAFVLVTLAARLAVPQEQGALVFAAIAIAAIAGRKAVTNHRRDRAMGPLGDVSTLSIYDLARLFRGPRHAAFTAAVALIAHGHARVHGSKMIERVSPVGEGSSEWERAADRALADGPCTVAELETRLSPLVVESVGRTVALGLEFPDVGLDRLGTLSALAVAMGLIALGVAWKGALGGGPFGYIIAAEVALFATLGPGRPANARRLKALLATRFGGLAGRQHHPLPPGELVIAVGLFGGLALEGTDLWDLTKAFNDDRISAESCG